MSTTPSSLGTIRARFHTGRIRPSIAAVGLVAAVLPFVPADSMQDGPVLCPFRRMTGLPCPGCGLTRSVSRFAHGEWRASFHEHLFGPLVYVAAIALVVAAVGWRLGTPSEVCQRAWTSTLARRVALVVGSVWMVWAAVRLGRDVGAG